MVLLVVFKASTIFGVRYAAHAVGAVRYTHVGMWSGGSGGGGGASVSADLDLDLDLNFLESMLQVGAGLAGCWGCIGEV
jgi:hypothetical protein